MQRGLDEARKAAYCRNEFRYQHEGKAPSEQDYSFFTFVNLHTSNFFSLAMSPHVVVPISRAMNIITRYLSWHGGSQRMQKLLFHFHKEYVLGLKA